jgi:hypothetical protein
MAGTRPDALRRSGATLSRCSLAYGRLPGRNLNGVLDSPIRWRFQDVQPRCAGGPQDWGTGQRGHK